MDYLHSSSETLLSNRAFGDFNELRHEFDSNGLCDPESRSSKNGNSAVSRPKIHKSIFCGDSAELEHADSNAISHGYVQKVPPDDGNRDDVV